jgi:hypothetical protein
MTINLNIMNVEAAVAKRIDKTWMQNYNTQARADLVALDDADLQRAYKRFSGYLNDRTEPEKAKIAALYAELLRREYQHRFAQEEAERQAWTALERTGVWPGTDNLPVPKVGERVKRMYPALFGLGMLITGRVYRAKVGLRVRLDAGQPIAGAKTVGLDRGWRIAG